MSDHKKETNEAESFEQSPRLNAVDIVFDCDEAISILEFAREAMSDALISDEICERMCMDDSEMIRLREKLQAVMDSDVMANICIAFQK